MQGIGILKKHKNYRDTKIDTLDGKMQKINCDIIIDKIQIEIATKIKG